MIGSGRKSVRMEIEDNFTSLPRGCYIELEKVAKEHILSNLKQYRVDKRSRIEQVKHFTEDTSLPLNLEYFLDYHGISLLELYRTDGTRSFQRLKQWAGLETDQREIGDDVYKKFSGLLQVNSRKLLEF